MDWYRLGVRSAADDEVGAKDEEEDALLSVVDDMVAIDILD